MFPFATLQDDGEALQEQFARDRIKGNEPEVYACLDGPDNPPKKRYAGGGGSWGGNEWDYSAFKNNAWVLSFFVNDWIPVAGQIDDVVPAVVGIYSVVQFTIDNQEKIAESIAIQQPEGKSAYNYIPPPKDLKGFPKATKVKNKSFRKRWKDSNGDILEWDYQEGHIEKYDPNRNHKGAFDANTGKQIKAADPKRRIKN